MDAEVFRGAGLIGAGALPLSELRGMDVPAYEPAAAFPTASTLNR